MVSGKADFTHEQLQENINLSSPEVLAYIAGFLDGEGCIQINKINSKARKQTGYSPRYYLMISATQAHPEPIQLLKNIFGGTIDIRNLPSHKKLAAWRLQGKSASMVLKSLIPYLKVKKTQAIVASEFQDSILTRNNRRLSDEELNRRENIKQQLHEFKHEEYDWSNLSGKF